MNTGMKNGLLAIQQARENARFSKETRYVYIGSMGTFIIEKTPPNLNSPMCPDHSYLEVYPDGGVVSTVLHQDGRWSRVSL